MNNNEGDDVIVMSNNECDNVMTIDYRELKKAGNKFPVLGNRSAIYHSVRTISISPSPIWSS